MSTAIGVVALFLGVVFLILFVPLELQTLGATEKPAPAAELVAFSTAVAGYVAGIIALWFGVAPTNRVETLGLKLAPAAGGMVRTIIGFAYLVAYFGVALLAVFLWVTKTSVAPDVLILQATAAGGLAFAIVTNLFKQTSASSPFSSPR